MTEPRNFRPTLSPRTTATDHTKPRENADLIDGFSSADSHVREQIIRPELEAYRAQTGGTVDDEFRAKVQRMIDHMQRSLGMVQDEGNVLATNGGVWEDDSATRTWEGD